MKSRNIFRILLATALAAFTTVACEKAPVETDKPEDKVPADELTVEPSSKIIFKAAENDPVVLKVMTNVEDWTFELPQEWLSAVKEGDKLTITAEDNLMTSRRMGRVVIMAGDATPVKINIAQEPAAEAGCIGSLTISGNTSITRSGTYAIDFKLSKPAEELVSVKVKYDPSYLEKYNSQHEAQAKLLSEGSVRIMDQKNIIMVPAGRQESNNSAEVEININVKEIEIGTQYIIPITVESVTNAYVPEESKTLVLTYSKASVHDMRNVLLFEVNSVNPLNALEYVLEDGTNFFDAVVLFSGNINYNANDDFVYLHKNPSILALLDNSETYLQPLRDRNIKVYLGILGNHDISGVCQLSDWGAEQFAREVAQTCFECKIDGVMLDDEYSYEPPTDNKWFVPHSQAAGGRLCYELKKAMKEACPWPTDVTYYQYGGLKSPLPDSVKDQETGEVHTVSEYIDGIFPNYGESPWWYGDLGTSDCARYSINCSTMEGTSFSMGDLQKAMDQGYGWLMWYSLDPVPGVKENLTKGNLDQMRRMAPVMFGSDLVSPTGYYKKVEDGEKGAFDPQRYTF